MFFYSFFSRELFHVISLFRKQPWFHLVLVFVVVVVVVVVAVVAVVHKNPMSRALYNAALSWWLEMRQNGKFNWKNSLKKFKWLKQMRPWGCANGRKRCGRVAEPDCGGGSFQGRLAALIGGHSHENGHQIQTNSMINCKWIVWLICIPCQVQGWAAAVLLLFQCHDRHLELVPQNRYADIYCTAFFPRNRPLSRHSASPLLNPIQCCHIIFILPITIGSQYSSGDVTTPAMNSFRCRHISIDGVHGKSAATTR